MTQVPRDGCVGGCPGPDSRLVTHPPRHHWRQLVKYLRSCSVCLPPVCTPLSLHGGAKQPLKVCFPTRPRSLRSGWCPRTHSVLCAGQGQEHSVGWVLGVRRTFLTRGNYPRRSRQVRSFHNQTFRNRSPNNRMPLITLTDNVTLISRRESSACTSRIFASLASAPQHLAKQPSDR